MSNVFIAFQLNEDSRAIVDALADDNPHAKVQAFPAMVKVDAEGKLTLKRQTVEDKIGRPFDLQELHVNLISLSGNIDETDDEFVLSWKH